MTALVWDQSGERFYEAGIDRGVYYPPSGDGVAWNGLVSVRESSSGGTVTPYYIDGVKHLDVVESEDFEATLTAYSAPKEFIESGGVRSLHSGFYVNGQPRSTFGLSYRTLQGNDLEGSDYGYVLHLIYNATAAPVEKTYATLSGKNSAPTFDWSLSTVPVRGVGFKPSAHFELHSKEITDFALAFLEDVLYGSDTVAPRLPSVSEVLEIVSMQNYVITDVISEPL